METPIMGYIGTTVEIHDDLQVLSAVTLARNNLELQRGPGASLLNCGYRRFNIIILGYTGVILG